MTINELELGTIVSDGMGNFARVMETADGQMYYALTLHASGDCPVEDAPIVVSDFYDEQIIM